MKRSQILREAEQCITVDRAATHGRAENTFGTIAALWSVWLGHEVTARDAAMMLGLVKVARARGNIGHQDNYVDLAGYAALAGELAGPATMPTPEYECANCGDKPMVVTVQGKCRACGVDA